MRTAPELIDALRQPAYTGENRCLPCTVLNILITLVLAIGVGTVSPPLGLATLAGAGLAIYLRGYLVPGTPTLTKRYLPDHVLTLFGKAPARTPTIEPTDEGGWDALEGAGVVTRGADGVRLADGFHERWRREIRELQQRDLGSDAVAVITGTDDVDARGDLSFVVGGDQLLRWESQAALIADAAAASVFQDRYEGWEDLDRSARRDLLRRLRLLLDRCPSCDGPTETVTERATHCCRKTRTIVSTTCPDCGAFIAEVVATDPVADGWAELPTVETDSRP